MTVKIQSKSKYQPEVQVQYDDDGRITKLGPHFVNDFCARLIFMSPTSWERAICG